MSTPSARYPLDRALPPDVALGGESIAAFYQRFPIFSLPWVWRRFLLFTPFAFVPSIIAGMDHAAMVDSVHDALSVTFVNVAAKVFAISAGPLAAAAIRYARLPTQSERRLVTAAILLGIVAAVGVRLLADLFHDWRMLVHGVPEMQHEARNVYEVLEWGLDSALWLFFYFIAGGGLALPAYYSESARWLSHLKQGELEAVRRQRDEADMQLTVLQAQVEPHFLFNTLASVRSLVGSDPARAAETIDALSEHLRATLPRLRAETGIARSTLGEQFAICESYLKVMKLRMGDRLRTSVVLPEALRDLAFPPLMLLSLVENAVKHGVEPKAGPVEIRLEASVVEPRRIDCGRVDGGGDDAGRVGGPTAGGDRLLEVRVVDDGVGLRAGTGVGTGLENIRAQLRNHFGARAGLLLETPSTGGVVARLSVPMSHLA